MRDDTVIVKVRQLGHRPGKRVAPRWDCKAAKQKESETPLSIKQVANPKAPELGEWVRNLQTQLNKSPSVLSLVL